MGWNGRVRIPSLLPKIVDIIWIKMNLVKITQKQDLIFASPVNIFL